MNRNLGIAIFSGSTALIIIAFGFVGDNTRWLHRKPLICFDAKELSSNNNISIAQVKQTCITHVTRPYAKKQGSVVLDVSTTLEDGRTFFYRTIFWLAENIGRDRFSDIPGDFTTLYFQIYDKYGFSQLKIQDTSSGWQRANSTPDRYLELCPYMPVLLNKLHFQSPCRDSQVALWKNIRKSSIILDRNHYKPLDDSFVSAVINHPLVSLFTILLTVTASLVIRKKGFRYWFRFSKIFNLGKQISIANFSPKAIRTSRVAIFTQYRRYAWIPSICVILIVLGLVASRTNLFTAKHISCKEHKFSTSRDKFINKDAFLDYSYLNICLDEIVSPNDSWLGIVNVVFTIYDQSGKSISADAIFFINDTVDFSDASGDIMYQSLNYYNKRGILVGHNHEITSEHFEDLMPEAASHALWQDVKDKTLRVADTKYLSPSRMLYLVATDSLPLMIAGGLLIYTYGISLSVIVFSQSLNNSTHKDD